MSIETATTINQLNVANPDGAIDYLNTADDHLRLIKSTLQNTFPAVAGAISASHTDLSSTTYLVDGGAVNALIATPTSAWTAYVAGIGLLIKPTYTNTGAVTINVSGLGAIAIKDASGLALSGGEMVAGSVYPLRYNGTSFFLPFVGLGKTTSADIQGNGAGDITNNVNFTGTPTTTTPGVADDSTKITNTAWSKLGLAYSLVASPGYFKLPSWMGGLIFQWGTGITSGASASFSTSLAVNFTTPFVSLCTRVGADDNADVRVHCQHNPGGTDSIDCYSRTAAGADITGITIAWFCVGI